MCPYSYNPLLVGKLDKNKRILNDLEDVNTSGTVNDKVLTYQNGTWIPQTPAGGGDMTRAVYDVNANDIVDNSERLEGETLGSVQAHTVDAINILGTLTDANIPDVETLSYGFTFADAQIPTLDASKIISGTFDATQIPDLPTSRIATGTFIADRIPTIENLKGTVPDGKIPDAETLSYGGAFAEGQIPNLPTTKITSGTFGLARIPSIDNAHLAGGITSDKIPALSGTAIAYPINADTVGTTQIIAGGVANSELAASGLDISKFTVGTAGVDRIPALPTTKITSGTFNADRIPILPTDRYGSAVLVSGTRSLTGDLDFAKHQAKAMALEALGSAPASPATAQLYYNTSTDKVMIYIA